MPRFKLQLLSPIEELELTKIWDLALICKFDPMKPAGKAVMMIDVTIVPEESMAPLDAVTDKKATMAVNSTLGNRSPLKESP